MKKLLLISSLLLSGYFSRAQTSTYFPFPDSNAVWSIFNERYTFQQPYTAYTYYIEIKGDTVIGNYTYQKLLDPGSPNNYYGAIRQDIATKKVYYLGGMSGDTDTLIYDFNLQVGDTAPSFSSDRIVEAIDSVLISGQYRKRFKFSDYPSMSGYDTWIEGIGSLNGLLYPLDYEFEGNYTLACMRQNGNDIYQYSTTNSPWASPWYAIPSTACYPLPVTEVNGMEDASAAPNPFENGFTLKLPKSTIAQYSITVFDVQGKTLLSKQVSSSDTWIDVDAPAGIYLLKISDKDGNITTRRLVKN